MRNANVSENELTTAMNRPGCGKQTAVRNLPEKDDGGLTIMVNSIDFKGSLNNGPGLRTLLFLQGCDVHCEGCHNTSTWNISDGTPYRIPDLVRLLEEGCRNKKITITGGEPLYQKEALTELIKALEGFDVCLYTSHERNDVPAEIMKRIKYLKTGKYDSKLRTTTKPYYGSTNQQFITIHEDI